MGRPLSFSALCVLSRAEYHALQEHGIPESTASKYRRRVLIPHGPRKEQIIALLGRDPWDGTTIKKAGTPRMEEVKDVPGDPLTEQERKASPINAPLLLSMILKRAIKDCGLPVHLDKNGRDTNKSFRESALGWVRDSTRQGITMFNGICNALGTDPDRVRERVLAGKVKFEDEDRKKEATP